MWKKIDKNKWNYNWRICNKCWQFKLWQFFNKNPAWFRWKNSICQECFNKDRKNNKETTKKYYEDNKEILKLRRKYLHLLEKDKDYIKSREKLKKLDMWRKDESIRYNANYLINKLWVKPEVIAKIYKTFDIETMEIKAKDKTIKKRNKKIRKPKTKRPKF